MDRSSLLKTFGVIGIILFFNAIAGLAIFGEDTTQSDGRRLQWDRFDVTLDNFDTAANRFNVTEAYKLSIQRGPFTFGFREIPMGRIEDIDAVVVLQEGTPLQASCASLSGSYCVTQQDDTLSIR